MRQETLAEFEFEMDSGITAQSARDYLINQINAVTEPVRSLCSLFTFEQISSIKKQLMNHYKVYSFIFVAQPGDAVFELNAKHETMSGVSLLKLNGLPI